MSNKMAGMKKATAVMLVATVGIFQSLITGAVMAQVNPKLAGDLSVRGTVTLNGVSTANGATVFDGGRIKTGSNGTAIINLGKRGQIELAEDSELILQLGAGIVGGNLHSGRATVSTSAGMKVNVQTVDGIAVSDGKEASVITVDVACGNTRVNSARSEAKVTAGNRVEIVAAGQEVAVGAQDTGNSRCPRLASSNARAGAATALSGGALAALIIIGVGATVAGVVAATQSDNSNFNTGGPLSNFRP